MELCFSISLLLLRESLRKRIDLSLLHKLIFMKRILKEMHSSGSWSSPSPEAYFYEENPEGNVLIWVFSRSLLLSRKSLRTCIDLSLLKKLTFMKGILQEKCSDLSHGALLLQKLTFIKRFLQEMYWPESSPEAYFYDENPLRKCIPRSLLQKLTFIKRFLNKNHWSES